jgi:tRNA(Ile)-lysidine synthase TilS/MesJ
MIWLLGKIPKECYVACSGGVDSMAALSFILNNPTNKAEVIFFNHNTPTSNKAEAFLRHFCEKTGLTLHIGYLDVEKPPGCSTEDFWREQRYKYFSNFKDKPIIKSWLIGAKEKKFLGLKMKQTKITTIQETEYAMLFFQRLKK